MRIEELERKEREEADRIAAEKEKKKQKEKEKKERQKKEGTYMTKKQKQQAALAQQRLEAMRAAGMEVRAYDMIIYIMLCTLHDVVNHMFIWLVWCISSFILYSYISTSHLYIGTIWWGEKETRLWKG